MRLFRLDAILDRLRSFLSALSRRRPKDSLRTTLLQIRVDELENKENADIKYLCRQLTHLRAENADLRGQIDTFCERFASLLHMPEEELCQTACRYEVLPSEQDSGWSVVLERCVFCGCGLEPVPFRTRRDALLYAALLEAVGHRPRNNLSCAKCYNEHLENNGLSVE